MARWFVCFLVFLQLCFLVLSDEITTVVPQSSQNIPNSVETITKTSTTSSSSETPTRSSSGPTASPPVDHSIGNNRTSMVPDTSNNAKNKTEHNNKNAALSVYSFSQIVMVATLGVVLSASAI